MHWLELPKFSGSLKEASAIDTWLNGCSDAFELYNMSNETALSPAQQILSAGVNFMQSHEDAASWWNENRVELKALRSWDDFTARVRTKFIPTNWRLDALAVIYNIHQRTTPFSEYLESMTRARGALTSAGKGYQINDTMFKHIVLFHSHPALQLRVRSQQGLDFANIKVDALTATMAMCWDSMIAERVVHPTRPAVTSPPAQTPTAPVIVPVVSRPPSTRVASGLPPMSAAEAQTIRDARGCYHCRRTPSSPGWTPHMARNCPGDPARNIPPVTASVSAVTLEFVDATAAAIAAYNPEVDDRVGGMAPSAVLNVASVQLAPGEPVPVDQADFWNASWSDDEY